MLKLIHAAQSQEICGPPPLGNHCVLRQRNHSFSAVPLQSTNRPALQRRKGQATLKSKFGEYAGHERPASLRQRCLALSRRIRHNILVLCPFWAQCYNTHCLRCRLVRIIARKTLRGFIDSLHGSKDRKAVKSALESWFHEVQNADWHTPADVTKSYANASIVGHDRVVFNIKGNTYRLVVAIDYRRQIVFIKWLGSHAEYDEIDVKTVSYGD
jgi:mRNA interferase HigB